MSETLTTPSLRARKNAALTLKYMVENGVPWRFDVKDGPGYVREMRAVADWLESMGDEPEEADANDKL